MIVNQVFRLRHMIVALLLFVVNITSNLLISYAPLLVKSVE